MRKNVAIRILCLTVAIVMLSGAAVYAVVNGSPYETLKKALLDAVTYRNVTIDGQMTMTVDGVVQSIEKSYIVNGDNSSLIYYFNEDGVESWFNYTSESLSINRGYTEDDGTMWYRANIYPKSHNGYSSYAGVGGSFMMFNVLTAEERSSAQMRFAELLMDALVGDLKNNVMMDSGDGIKNIRGTLTENQVPELLKAGVDLLVEQSGGYYHEQRDISFDGNVYVYELIQISHGMKTVHRFTTPVRLLTEEEARDMEDGLFYSKAGDSFHGFSYIDGITYLNVEESEIVIQNPVPVVREDFAVADPIDIPMKSLTIDYVHGEAEVDMDGVLLSINLRGAATLTSIFGDTHAVEVDFTVKFSDIGVSNPACPIPGAEQLLTAEYAKTNFGNEYMGVYFKLNEDGSIDASSVTTTFPGELDRDVTLKVQDVLSGAYPSQSSYVVVSPVPGPFQNQPSTEFDED